MGAFSIQQVISLWRKLILNLAYYRRPPWDTGQVPPEVEEFIRTHPPGRALDVGCGSGTSSIALAQAGWTVTGIDLAPRAIHLARLKAKEADVQINFQAVDILHFQANELPYDLVLDIGCFHSLSFSHRLDYLHKLDRWLAPEGTWLMYAFLARPGDRRNGLRPADLDLVELHLQLIRRQDGTDRGNRPSAWFWFQKPPPSTMEAGIPH